MSFEFQILLTGLGLNLAVAILLVWSHPVVGVQPSQRDVIM